MAGSGQIPELKTVGKAIDGRKNRANVNCGLDHFVGETGIAQLCHVLFADRHRIAGKLVDIFQDRRQLPWRTTVRHQSLQVSAATPTDRGTVKKPESA